MTIVSVPTQSYLQSIFTPDEYKDIQDCVLHCNEHFAYRQKSWQKIASDNKRSLIALITLVVSGVISYNTLRVPMLSIAIPSLYIIVKGSMLYKKATKRFHKTAKTFLCVSQKHDSIKDSSLYPDKEKKCLDDLVYLILMQMTQDKMHLYTMDDFVDGCKVGVIGSCFTAMSVVAIRRLLQSPTSFSTAFKVATIFFTCFFGSALIAAGRMLINAYRYHLGTRNTFQEPVKNFLSEVNTTLGISFLANR